MGDHGQNQQNSMAMNLMRAMMMTMAQQQQNQQQQQQQLQMMNRMVAMQMQMNMQMMLMMQRGGVGAHQQPIPPIDQIHHSAIMPAAPAVVQLQALPTPAAPSMVLHPFTPSVPKASEVQETLEESGHSELGQIAKTPSMNPTPENPEQQTLGQLEAHKRKAEQDVPILTRSKVRKQNEDGSEEKPI